MTLASFLVRVTVLSSIFISGSLLVFAQTGDNTSFDTSYANDPYTGSVNTQNGTKVNTAFANPASGVRITTFPEFPEPGENVLVRIEGYSTDLGQATITWFVNGAPVRQGLGLRSISLKAGNSGSKMRIDVKAEDAKGRVYPASHVIWPSTVEIIWEADTYTPPFYSGKAMQTPGSRVRVTAFSNVTDDSGAVIPPSALTYTWKQGNKIIRDKSGRGKQSIVISNENVVGPLAITVSVTADNGYGGAASLTLNVENPEIVFYQNHPLLGMLYEHALTQTTTLTNNEINITAEPYFFSGKTKGTDTLAYSWLKNGNQDKTTSETGSAILVKGSTEGKAAALIDLRIRHKTVYMQSARQSLTVTSEGAN